MKVTVSHDLNIDSKHVYVRVYLNVYVRACETVALAGEIHRNPQNCYVRRDAET